MSLVLAVPTRDRVQDLFLSTSGVYYCPLNDEFFILDFICVAPCATGELVPKVRLEFCDEIKRGAVVRGEEIYLGPL